MAETTSRRVARLLSWLARAAVVVAVLVNLRAYASVAASRLFEPYALAWVEPIFMRGALAVFAGDPYFGPPSLHYTAGIYNPGVGWLAGTLFHATGPSLPVLRAGSFAAFVALVVGAAGWSYGRSRDWTCALVVGLLGLATSVSCQFVTTTANADVPCCLFGLLAFALVARESPSRAAVATAGVAVVLAFVFKQHGAGFGLAVALGLAARDRREAAWFACVAGGLGLLLELVLYVRSDGWSWVYSFRIPVETASRVQHHFWTVLLARNPFAVASLAAALPALWLLERSTRWLWLGLAVGALAMSYAGFSKAGGAANSLLPLYWTGIAAFGASYAAARRALDGVPRTAVSLTLLAVAALAATAQLGEVRDRAALLAARSPDRPDQPTYPRRARFERSLREAVASVDGGVFVGARFAAWADLGRPLNTHQIPIMEGTDRAAVFDPAVFERALARQPYRTMFVWDHPFDPTFDRLLAAHYQKVKRFAVDPLAGHKVDIWEPIERSLSSQ